MAPQTPLFSPITREVTGYRQTKSNNTRPLMYPEEVLQLDNKECMLLIRGQKPLKAFKIIPDKLSAYSELVYSRVTEYIPQWHDKENGTVSKQHNFTVHEEPIQRYAKPNFGTNADQEETPEEKKEEHYEQVQITVDENVYDPQNPDEFVETDVEDILND
jgi:type IV secretion system protein VirD4